jgi:transcriptional regulator with XRE-family HTH domain
MDLNGPEMGMMHDREPTIRSRELGNRLRTAMYAADLTGKLVAEQLGWAQSTISRLLAGKHFGKDNDIAAFLAVCGVTGHERHQLLQLARDAHRPGTRMPKRLGTYTQHTTEALHVTEFQSAVIPEILQTADYARTQLLASGRPSPTAVGRAVALRLDRATLLNDDEGPPHFEFYLHEWLLRTPVGNRETMSDQLHHLLRMSVRPRVTLRIVPIAAGAIAAQSGPFGLLEFEHYGPAVHRPEEDADAYLEEPEEILTYRDILTRLGTVALNVHRSRAAITEVITTLWA